MSERSPFPVASSPETTPPRPGLKETLVAAKGMRSEESQSILLFFSALLYYFKCTIFYHGPLKSIEYRYTRRKSLKKRLQIGGKLICFTIKELSLH